MVLESAAGQTFALIILTAAIVTYIAYKLNQPTIIAYIITGLILGKAGLNLVSGSGGTKVLSELGLAFLLFLIGLEIRLEDIKNIAKPVTIIAVIQMPLTGMAGFAFSYFLGFALIESIFIGLASMFSSTAVVVKILSDKDEISTLTGKIDIGVLLIQDLAVIILLAVIGTRAAQSTTLILKIGEILAMVLFIGGVSYLSSKFFLPRLFREISENKHAFFIHGIAWAFLLISLADMTGISKEIGAFFAGVSLGQIPYSQELKERVRPLTDFFMAIFFINIGLKLSPASLTAYWKEALVMSFFLMLTKFGLIMIISDKLKFTPETSFSASLNLSQTSEFSLVLGAIGLSAGLIGQGIVGFLSIIAITTMGISSYLITYSNHITQKAESFLEPLRSEEKTDVEVKGLEGHVLVAGYDGLARKVTPVLADYFDQIVVVDRNPLNVEELSNSDYEYIYGDLSHSEIRHNSGVKKADLILSFVPDPWINRRIVEEADKESTVFAKAKNREEAAELYEMGASYVTIKNVLASNKVSEYIKLYLENRELFLEEVRNELNNFKKGENVE